MTGTTKAFGNLQCVLDAHTTLSTLFSTKVKHEPGECKTLRSTQCGCIRHFRREEKVEYQRPHEPIYETVTVLWTQVAPLDGVKLSKSFAKIWEMVNSLMFNGKTKICCFWELEKVSQWQFSGGFQNHLRKMILLTITQINENFLWKYLDCIKNFSTFAKFFGGDG